MKIKEILGFCACVTVIAVALVYGLEKESERLEHMRDKNCQYYGEHINDTYGREVC